MALKKVTIDGIRYKECKRITGYLGCIFMTEAKMSLCAFIPCIPSMRNDARYVIYKPLKLIPFKEIADG